MTARSLRAARSITLASTGGAVSASDITSSGGSARISAAGDIGVGNVTTAGSIFLTGGGAITAGDLDAGVGTLLPGESSGATDAAPAGIASGFDDSAVQRCDDCATGAITLPFTIDYFGNSYSVTYVSNNGYITFNTGQGSYTPGGLGTGYSGQPIVAAFFADVDTNNAASSQTRYGSGTYAGRNAFGATWDGVGYFPGQADKLNNFQIILTDRSDTGTGNFDIYLNYGGITWETGSASGGTNGFGGTSAAVGYNAGIRGNPDGTYFELPGSRVPGSFLNTGSMPLITTTNDGNPGQLFFAVRNGQVVSASEPPTVHVNNVATGNSAAINIGNVSGEAADIHGAGAVNVGGITVADRGSGIASTGLRYAAAVQAAGSLVVSGDVNSTGAALLGSDTADVSAGSIVSQSSVAVLANGTVTLGQVTSGTGSTDSLFVGGPGSLGTDSLSTYASGNDTADFTGLTPARVGGTVAFNGPVTTGSLIASAVGDITLGTTTVGTLLSLDTAGTARLSGQIGGPTLRVSSSDVAIDTSTGTAIGNTTDLIAFTNTGSRATQVGGGDVANAWSLSNDEFGRLSAHTITIDSPADADMTVGQLDIIGSAGADTATRRRNLTGSDLILTSGGNLVVTGAVNLTQAGAADAITFNSALTGEEAIGDERFVEILTDAGGSVAITNSAGAVAGNLMLTGDAVFVGARQALADLLGLGDIGAISNRLAINDGAQNEAGYLQAGGIGVKVDTGFFVQNSGVSNGMPDQRDGFTVGAGGIVVDSPFDDLLKVAVNGRIANADGSYATGAAVVTTLVNQNLASAGVTSVNDLDLVAGSTINGCVIGAPSCGMVPVPPGATQIADIVDQLTLLSSQTPDPFQFTFQSPQLINFGDLAPITLAPLIDEPVTGAGNEDLWTGIGYGSEPGSATNVGVGNPDENKKKH